jgi:hypothetical protein
VSQQAKVHAGAPVMQPAGCAVHPSTTTTTTTATMSLVVSVSQTPPYVKVAATVVVMWQPGSGPGQHPLNQLVQLAPGAGHWPPGQLPPFAQTTRQAHRPPWPA